MNFHSKTPHPLKKNKRNTRVLLKLDLFQSLTVVHLILIQRVAMRLIVDQSLAAGFIPINTRQQKVSLQFYPGVLEEKVYNNDDTTFFSMY